MTPFMWRVADVVGLDEPAVEPGTVPSRPRAVGNGADRYVAVRSLAEQLVCEANAVLAPGPGMTLVDDLSDGRLDFTIAYGTSRARVSTAFAGGHSLGTLERPGHDSGSVELRDADALPDLIVSLLQP